MALDQNDHMNSFIASFGEESLGRDIKGSFTTMTCVTPLVLLEGELLPSFHRSIKTRDDLLILTTLTPCKHYLITNARPVAGSGYITSLAYDDFDYLTKELPKRLAHSVTHPKFRRLSTISVAYLLSLYQRKFKAVEYTHRVPAFKEVRLLVDLMSFLNIPPHLHDNACNAIAMHNPFWSLCLTNGKLLKDFELYKSMEESEAKVALREKMKDYIKLGVKYGAEDVELIG